ncbi:MAG: type I 3-dehydroquinate dehydratase [Spirochaetaceae bacterium]|jgi:3-dehydroquinate dehydratase/shikimate dehydrogenase|nr:type I 3-dehydroquinate dehydratase [Spirochaetaceae bacterium]
MARICLCLTGKTLARDQEILEKYEKQVDLAELRVDCLEPDERLLVRRFPQMVKVPVILTVRRERDGGFFADGEGSRIILLSKGLAFAEADRRHNFAYVDLEEDLDVPSLEEAARTFGTRIIRSFHDFKGVERNLSGRLRALNHGGDEIVKAAVMPQSMADVVRIYETARELWNMEKILLCMGDYGTNTRILTELLGSHLTYAAVKGEADIPPGAPGQLCPKELVDFYRFRSINSKTRIFGVVGFPLKATSSPAFFNAVFTHRNIDAVYLPFPSDSLESFMKLADLIGLEGASVTVPYKEEILPYLQARTEEVDFIQACNTIVRRPPEHSGAQAGWAGANTDARGFSDALLEFTGLKDLKGKRLTIIGAGGAARAAAAAIYRLKGKALILNRTLFRARDLAARYRFAWAGLDGRGVDLMSKYSDVIIQTTSVGMEPEINADPLELYEFSGREVVMDLIYKPETTRFLKRAARAGCPIQNGYDMLIRQAQYQYTQFFGEDFPSQLLSRITI